VDAFDGLALARHFWPRFVATLILAALVFFPKPSYDLIEAEAKHRAREYTALLMEAVFPDAKPQGGKRAEGVGTT
jgi:hypothetical protein